MPAAEQDRGEGLGMRRVRCWASSAVVRIWDVTLSKGEPCRILGSRDKFMDLHEHDLDLHLH